MSYGAILRGGLTGATLIFHAACGQAQDAGQRSPTQTTTQRRISEEGRTIKERLGDKASDEQRVDNCNVPLDRRGPTLRPEGCSHEAAGVVPTGPAR